MKIKEITSKKDWTDYVLKKEGSLLQSWEWGEFKSHFQQVFRFGIRRNGSLVGVCQVFKEKLPMGSYFYIPYGPIGNSRRIRENLVKRALNLAEEEKSSFVRVEPIKKIDLGVKSFKRHQPWKTLVVDLEKDDLLSSFDKDTRYCIRRAKRENVRMQTSEDINSFYNLLKKASERHNFNTYSKEYFIKFLSIPFTKLLVATHKSQPIAAALVSYFGNRVTYLHAGSDYEKRKLNAPSLVNYKAMQIGIEKGFKEYNMWGIDEKDMPSLTKFKKGFGGQEVVYPEARDIPLSIKYKIYKTGYFIKSNLWK